MGGIFGVVSKNDCVVDVFFGTDYHSHLGTKKGGMCILEENSFNCDGKDIPKDHVLNVWLKRLKNNGWWMPWMDEATEITFYTGEYREGEVAEPPAV